MKDMNYSEIRFRMDEVEGKIRQIVTEACDANGPHAYVLKVQFTESGEILTTSWIRSSDWEEDVYDIAKIATWSAAEAAEYTEEDWADLDEDQRSLLTDEIIERTVNFLMNKAIENLDEKVREEKYYAE